MTINGDYIFGAEIASSGDGDFDGFLVIAFEFPFIVILIPGY
jgi:hypothetical protein